MLALMTLSKGSFFSFESPFVEEESWLRYFSDRMASSPRTAYWASLTCGLMLSMFRLRREAVEDIVRAWRAGMILVRVLVFFKV